MKTIQLISPNDHIRQRSTVFEDENSVGTSRVAALARHATVMLSVSEMDAAIDGAGCYESNDITDASCDVEGLGVAKRADGCEDEGLKMHDGWIE